MDFINLYISSHLICNGFLHYFYLTIVNVIHATNDDNLINLQASPCIRFNKEGILLAVSTNDNGVKILANPDGIRLLRTMETRTFDASRVASASVVKVKISP